MKGDKSMTVNDAIQRMCNGGMGMGMEKGKEE